MRKNSHSTFFRSIMLYQLAFMLIIILITTLMSQIFVSQTREIIIANNKSLLSQIKSSTDKYLLEQIQNLIDIYFHKDTLSPVTHTLFQNSLNEEAENLAEVDGLLQTIKEENPFIRTICLYNKQSDTLISSTDHVVKNASFSPDIELDTLFFSYIRDITSDIWISPLNNIELWNAEGLLTYVHGIPTTIPETFFERNYFSLIISIDTENIISHMQNVEHSGANSDFLILSEDNKILAHSNSQKLYSVINTELYKNISQEDEGLITRKIDGQRNTIIWVKSDIQNVRYVTIIPFNTIFQKIRFFQLITVLAIAMLLAVGFVVWRHINRKTSQLFRNVASRARNQLNNLSDDNVEAINQIVDNFSEQQKRMSGIMEKYDELVLDKLFVAVLTGEQEDVSELLTQSRELGYAFAYRHYLVAIIEIDQQILKLIHVGQREFSVYGIMETAQNHLEEHCCCLMTRISPHQIACLLNCDATIPQPVFSQLLRVIYQEYKIHVNIIVSEPFSDLDAISKNYTSTTVLAKYDYVYGYANVLYTKALAEQEHRVYELPDAVAQQLEEALRAGNKEAFTHLVASNMQSKKLQQYSCQSVRNAAMRMISMICKNIRSRKLDLPAATEILEQTNDFTLEQSINLIQELSDLYFATIEAKNTDADKQRTQAILAYINSHMSSDLSLASAAEQFQVSTGYLSRFFKENVGQPFSKYVVERKLNLAAKRLVTDRHRTIAEIATSLGYYDAAYFSKLFKDRFGVTPGQYRKQNRQ